MFQHVLSPLYLFQGYYPKGDFWKSADAVWVWGRAGGAEGPHNEWRKYGRHEGILELAAACNQHYRSPYLVIPGYEATPGEEHLPVEERHGFPGEHHWRDYILENTNVTEDSILCTSGEVTDDFNSQGWNTRTEMLDFLKLAREREWRRVIGVTQCSHAMRAMMGTVRSMQVMGISDLLVAPVYPIVFDWNQKVYGSQGEGPYTRAHWITEENKRIRRYMEKGDLCAFEEMHAYMDRVTEEF